MQKDAERGRIDQLLGELRESIEDNAVECVPKLEELIAGIDSPFKLSLLGDLQDSLLGLSLSMIPEAPSSRPPAGFDSVGVADDEQYDESTLVQLERKGYRVYRPVATDSDMACKLIDRARPVVLLSDLGFPTPAEGRALMTLASERPWIKLVIAVSHGRIAPGTLPEGVEDCSGGAEWKDAERIHRIIWRKAIQNGVSRAV